jgi:hypothetical protein
MQCWQTKESTSTIGMHAHALCREGVQSDCCCRYLSLLPLPLLHPPLVLFLLLCGCYRCCWRCCCFPGTPVTIKRWIRWAKSTCAATSR